MNRKRYVLTALILISILLSGCGALAPAKTESAPAPTPLAPNPVVAPVITVVVQPTPMPVIIQPTAMILDTPAVAPGFSYASLPACDNPDQSTPLNDPTEVGSGWLIKTGDLWSINIDQASGCNLVFEGRIVPGEKVHRVIVLRSANGENTQYVKNGVFNYAEGSVWQKPRDKNMEDLNNTVDPPESMKLVNDKRSVMTANDYNWPIIVSFVNGSEMTFGPGETWKGLAEENHCNFAAPVKINVHGEKLAGANQFAAAIGATNCTTVAWIDGAKTPTQWVGQRDAANKVVYTTIDAWLMPSAWTKDQIDAWVSQKH